jgi:hypothetical protein
MGSLAEVIVDELIARSAPGTGSDSEIHPGTISEGAYLWLHRSVSASGYDWYQVVARSHPLLEADPTVWDAWVAAGSRDGEPWIAPVTLECPDDPTLDAVARMPGAARVGCFGSASIRLEGWVHPRWGSGGCDTAEPGWLTCPFAKLILVSAEPPGAALQQPGGAPGWETGASRLALAFPPGMTRPTTSTGQAVVAIGHFDDPAAEECGYPEDGSFPVLIVPDPDSVQACRGYFVLESISVGE